MKGSMLADNIILAVASYLFSSALNTGIILFLALASFNAARYRAVMEKS